MNREESLRRSAAFLDEATENLTFDAFSWSLEEAWQGVAWALHAISSDPQPVLMPGTPGLPLAGSLYGLLERVSRPPAEVGVVSALESLRDEISQDKSGFERAAMRRKTRVVQAVFDAWALHDVCGQRLGLVDERLGDGLMLDKASPGRVNSRVMDRRGALKALLMGSMVPLAACTPKLENESPTRGSHNAAKAAPKSPPRQANLHKVTPMRGATWETSDPFLFCAYHLDDYPAGNAEMGPAASLEGRQLGRDFTGRDNWRMYHGRTVPGFPRHPHRGFETVTVVRAGLLDHSDSMGATARYGEGDVQWLTAGGGIQHAEMFPLLHQDSPNPLELYQIWLNLPARDKMVDPHFSMLWSEKIPKLSLLDSEGKKTVLTVSAGSYKGSAPPSPPPNSWASRPEAQVAIWTLHMDPGARFTLPEVGSGVHRSLYLHRGQGATVANQSVANNHRVEVREPGPVEIQAGAKAVEILLLQGRPIGEPVARRGPFVMNHQDEIRKAYSDYRRTQFGGWPWKGSGPVHVRTRGRFARHIDGRSEEPT